MAHYEYVRKSFQVEIVNLAGLTGIGSDDGGTVDHVRGENYSPLPSTTLLGLDKERGNMRYEAMVRELGLYNTIRIYDRNSVGATGDVSSSSYQFKIDFDRESAIYYPDFPSLTDEEVVNKLISDALSRDINQRRFYYDPVVPPVLSGNDGVSFRIIDMVAGALGGGDPLVVGANVLVTRIR